MARADTLFRVTAEDASFELVERLLRDFPKEADTALMRSVNRGGDFARTRIARILAQHLTISTADLKRNTGGSGRAIRYYPMTKNRDNYEIFPSSRRLPLARFSYKGGGKLAKRRDRKNKRVYYRREGKYLRYKIGKGDPWKEAREAFVARMPTGYVGIYKRLTKKRKPIYQLRGPSLAEVLSKRPELRTLLAVDVSEVIAKRLQSQIDNILRRREAAQNKTDLLALGRGETVAA